MFGGAQCSRARGHLCPWCEHLAQPDDALRHYNAPVATELSINRRDEAGGVVLALSGELDVVSAPELELCLNEVMAEAHDRVVLDLSELAFVDSAGVSVLIKARQDAESSGRTLVLGRPTEQVHRVFALVGLADWLTFDS
jgi:anti-sigma B factor antagonist